MNSGSSIAPPGPLNGASSSTAAWNQRTAPRPGGAARMIATASLMWNWLVIVFSHTSSANGGSATISRASASERQSRSHSMPLTASRMAGVTWISSATAMVTSGVYSSGTRRTASVVAPLAGRFM